MLVASDPLADCVRIQNILSVETEEIVVCYYQEKRQQLLTEIRTLCEAPCYQGLVEFHGAFYTPDSGQISIALEYMDGGSLADILRLRKRIPEPLLSSMFQKLLHVSMLIHTQFSGTFKQKLMQLYWYNYACLCFHCGRD